MPNKDSGSLTAKNAEDAAEVAGKLYRGGRQGEVTIFNPKSAKTTPSEVMAAPGWYTTKLHSRADAVADVAIPYLALSSRSSVGVDRMVVPLASIAFLAVRLLSSSAGVAALAVRL
jgi:hypothetical protein